MHLRCTLDLLEQIVSEPCFNTLRTQQQLAYSVNCGVRLTHRMLGFAFVILSGQALQASRPDNKPSAILLDFSSECCVCFAVLTASVHS